MVSWLFSVNIQSFSFSLIAHESSSPLIQIEDNKEGQKKVGGGREAKRRLKNSAFGLAVEHENSGIYLSP